ncbi:chorismate synthase, partial [Desulfovibrio sp. OttesenSCG-928-G11]|nr:chorismate synthase [Desulfovibrio sp. OttesenSCG-928-G11]
HGPGLGGVIDGCPAGLALEEKDLQRALDLRRPGPDGPGGAAASPRREADRVNLLSGIFNGYTTGAPIAFHVENSGQRSGDYDHLADVLRPGHADLGWLVKYGRRDHRGGGRSSGRETLCRVAGGAVAEKFLAASGVHIFACTQALGGLAAELADLPGAMERRWFSPDASVLAAWDALVLEAKKAGDSLGGLVRVEIHGLPAGLGEPVFDKLDARLAYAMMGVGAVKGVEIGRGFAAARARGGDNNDPILPVEPQSAAHGLLPGGAAYVFAGNHAGGILGGISTGAPVLVTCAVKPIASTGLEQRSITAGGEAATICVGGRHDLSAIPRIVPVLKAMAALTAADFMLLQRSAMV